MDKKSKSNGGVGFNDYLIMPVQRIPRYNLLLKELIKHTHETHKDYKNLQKALEGTMNVSEFMDSKMQEELNRRKLFKINNRMIFKDPNEKQNFILPHRKFVMDGYLTIIPPGCYNEEKKGWKKWYFILFTDMILYCEANNGIESEKYILGEQIPLQTVPVPWVRDIKHDNIFQLIAKDCTLTLQAEDEENKNKWVKGIENVIKNLIEKKPEMQGLYFFNSFIKN